LSSVAAGFQPADGMNPSAGWKPAATGGSLLVRRDGDVVEVDFGAEAALRVAERVGIQGGAALADGRGILDLDRPCRRLGLVPLPDLTADDSLVPVDAHGQLQAIPGVGLPGKLDGLVDAGDG